MFKKLIIGSAILWMTTGVYAADGLVSVKSIHNVDDTTAKLVKILKSKNMTVFTTIDHQAGATKVGEKLQPTKVVVFGNPKIGSPLMNCAPSIAIDLPQKALIAEDGNGDVWLSYNDPAYLVKRHEVKGCDAVVAKVTGALAAFAKGATAK